MGLIQLMFPSKFIGSDMCTEMSVYKNTCNKWIDENWIQSEASARFDQVDQLEVGHALRWSLGEASVFMFTKHVLSPEGMLCNPASLISLSSLQKGRVSSGKNGLLLSPMLTPLFPPLNSDNRHCQPANKTCQLSTQRKQAVLNWWMDHIWITTYAKLKEKASLVSGQILGITVYLTKSYILWVLWTTESYWLLLYTVKYWDCCLPFFVLITR